jgi:hypothetical protein
MTSKQHIKCIRVASLAVLGHFLADPITYNGLLLDALDPQLKDGDYILE